MIEVRNLTKIYGDHTAVDHISFSLAGGKVYGFLGPNGAGKSTTMNMICGCLAPTEGEVFLGGVSVQEEPELAKSAIGYLPEIPPLYTDMTAREYLSFVSEAKGMRGEDIRRDVDAAIAEVGLDVLQHRLIRNLSKGYRQRVGIASAMLGEPEIIILDEPTVGLDPAQIIEIRRLIRKLGETKTVILSSHILQEISAVCDHVLIIANGKLVANNDIDSLRAYLGTSAVLTFRARGERKKIDAVLEGIEEVTGFTAHTIEPGHYTYKLDMPAVSDRISEKLFFAFAAAGIPLYELTAGETSLEDVFLRLTGGETDGSDTRLFGEAAPAVAPRAKKSAPQTKKTARPAPKKAEPRQRRQAHGEYTSLFGSDDKTDKGGTR